MQTKLLFCLLLLLASFAAFGETLPAELLSTPLPQDPAVLFGKLDNGLGYYILRNARPAKLAELRLVVNAGSVDEDEDQRGLAHFTEHMAFNGTRNYPKAEITKYMSSIGMGYQNGLGAGTSYDFTVYSLKIPTDDGDKFSKGVHILSEMAYNLSFEPAEIERERGVIIEEWRLGQSADQRVSDAQNAVILAGSRYAERSPIGTYEVISSFPRETLVRFYKDWYRPDLQTVIAVGDFEPEAMLDLIKEYFGPIPARENPRPKQLHYVPDNLQPLAVVTTDREYSSNDLTVMWKRPLMAANTLGDYLKQLRHNLFFTMFNNRLDELAKQADPPYSFAWGGLSPQFRTLSSVRLYANFTPGRAEQALQTLMAETERVQRFGFLPSEFARARIDLRRDAEREAAGKNTRDSNMLSWQMAIGPLWGYVIMDPEQRLQLLDILLDAITPEEVNALIGELIPDSNLCLTLAGPDKADLEYPPAARLLEIAQSANALSLEPWEDKTVDEPLLAEIPAPRPIRRETLDVQTGIRTWELANGVTVHAKKTDFKDDEVLLSATSPGGYCLYPPELAAAAQLLPDYVAESGCGNFDASALDKALAGKIARAQLTLGLASEGFSAYCSPRDLETMFQLVHQYGTNARFDEQDFSSFLQRTKNYYANLNLDPMQFFMDQISSAVYGGNPYAQSLATANLDAVRLADLDAIWRDRFADFSDFDFVIVGNYDESQLRQLCQIYLANLPAAGRRDKIRKVGLEPQPGKQEKRFHMGESGRSFVSHITNGKYSPGPREQVILDALTNVLNEKLFENIREDRSGVYFVQMIPSTEFYPVPHFQMISLMGCAPERVDELSDAIFATLDSIRAGRFDQRYIVAARATLEQRRAEDIRSNRFWTSQLLGNLKNKRPLTEFLKEPRHYPEINRKNLAKAARHYLNYGKNRLSLILLPENLKE
ncbi:MAG TPA: insulinase family protein [Candidatus Syntrophosphaera sp.]|nr:insulinase family protein [Candidatus Syntrophosphaera sp.]